MKNARAHAPLLFIGTILLSSVATPQGARASELPGDYLYWCINMVEGVNTGCTSDSDLGQGGGNSSGAASGGQGDSAPKGSPNMPDGASGNLNGMDPLKNGGNPVSLIDRQVVRYEIDFLLPTTYGLNLIVSRNYHGNRLPLADESGAPVADFSQLFGPGWRSPYDTKLYVNIAEDLDDNYTGNIVEYMLRDERGHRVLFQSFVGLGVALSPIFDGPRSSLTVTPISVPGFPDIYEYTIEKANKVKMTFDNNGNLIRYRGNAITGTLQEINIMYDLMSRPVKVNASGDDDRYILFKYPDSTTRQVESIDFVAGTTTYEDIVSYEYGITGLEEVHYGGGLGASYSIRYEYGTFDPNDPEDLDPMYFQAIGRVSYAQDGGPWQPISAYEYIAENGSENPQSVSAQYSYDPIGELWVKNVSFQDKKIFFEGTTAVDKPFAQLDFNLLNEVKTINYDNTTWPEAQPTWSRYEELPGSPSVLTGIKAPHELRLLTSSETIALFFPTKQWDYDGGNSDWSLQYRLLAERTFTTWNESTETGDFLETEYEYDTNYPHLVSMITNPEGESVVFTYHPPTATNIHARGRRATITRSGVVTSFDYHDGTGTSPGGLLATVTTPFGETEYEYDTRGQVTEITAPDGSVTEFEYNDFGHVTQRTTELGTWEYAYSSDEFLIDGTTVVPTAEVYFPPRLLQVRDPEGNVTRYKYNGAGKIVETIDPNNISTEFVYDDRLRLTLVRNGEGDEHEFEYDSYGRMVAFSDGRGLTTTYDYDEFGRVVRIEDPEGTERAFVYGGGWGASCSSCLGGSAGKVSRIEQRDGTFVHYEYDLAGRLLNVEYSTGDDPSSTKQLEFLYDLASRPISVSDTRLPFTSDEYLFLYDTGNTGLLERIVHPDGHTQDFHYDTNLQTSGYIDVDGNIAQYTRDTLGRVTILRDTYGDGTDLVYATPSDTGYPIGAVMERGYGNRTSEEYIYDPLGRIETINHFNPASSRIDYVSLEYGAAGEILSRERKAGSSFFTTTYDYDDAYRLIFEEVEDASSNWQHNQFYYYDGAGNRTNRLFNNHTTGDTPAYLYASDSNKLEEVFFGYLAPGGEVANALFEYDDRGNMTERLLRTDHTANDWDSWTYQWNEDDRLVKATMERIENSLLVGTSEYNYWYDYVGRRILSELPDGTLIRHYFNGLTEEVRKVSVTDDPDPSDFEFHVELDGTESTPPSGWPSVTAGPLDLVTEYYELDGSATYALGDFSTGTGNSLDIEGHRTIALRLRCESGSTSSPSLFVTIDTDIGRRMLVYQPARTAADTLASPTLAAIGFTGGRAGNFWDDQWTRFERDLQAEVDRFWPGEDLQRVCGFLLHVSSNQTVYLKDITFSNSITIEHNTLGGGAIGHIVRNRRVETDTAVLADTWFHYDQVGSVLSESDASGNLSATHYQDAFGVRQADWQTGLPGGVREGWAHNTKELDPGTGLMYMYQRHYIPEYGQFMSRAPYETMYEHEYTFAEGNPVMGVDPDGRVVIWNPLTWGDGWVDSGHFFTGGRGAAAELAKGAGQTIVDPTAAYGAPIGGTPPPYHHILPPFIPYVLSGQSCAQNADRNTKWFQEQLGPDYYVQTIFISAHPPYIEGENLGHYVTTITTPDGRTLMYDQYISSIPYFGAF